MPPLPIRGSVRSTMTPPIPKAQAWISRFPSTPTRPLLNLSQGVPGEAPERMFTDRVAELAAGREAANYGAIQGDEALRRAVREEMRDVYRWDEDERGSDGNEVVDESRAPGVVVGVEKDQIAISAGCNQAFFLTMSALCREGDEVIIPCPWYFNMLMTFQLLHLIPVPLPLSPGSNFTPSPDLARSLITERTRAIVLVTPNNPCGTVYPPGLIDRFYRLAKEKGVALVVDETYRDFVPPSPSSTETAIGTSTSPRGKPHALFSDPTWGETLISLFSFSKSYKIPGYRLGGIVASREVLEACRTLADCIQICPARIPQLALAELLPALRPSLISTSSALSSRLRRFTQALTHHAPGWSVISSGGYFAYVRFPTAYGPGVTSEDVAERLAVECGVLTLPGGWFMPEKGTEAWKRLEAMGSEVLEDRWLRFAIANVSDETVDKIPERLRELDGLYLRGGGGEGETRRDETI